MSEASALVSARVDLSKVKFPTADDKRAEVQDAEALYDLGKKYENSNGVSQDFRKAAELYCKAADQGYAEAQDRLGVMYMYGWGVGQNDEEAYCYFYQAYLNGYKKDIQGKLNNLERRLSSVEIERAKSRAMQTYRAIH
ncbi:hypothetical protein FACS1894187_14730 [Synergistales bacterium]|nr:hypothetical protein FACS1894187_14730 [Synergistales bacterium]